MSALNVDGRTRLRGRKRQRENGDVTGSEDSSENKSDSNASRGYAGEPECFHSPERDAALYATKTFHEVASQVISFLGGVLDSSELATLSQTIALPPMEKEFMLRLACRRSPWQLVYRLEEEYAAWESAFSNGRRVRDIIRQLRRDSNSGEGAFLQVCCGSDLLVESENCRSVPSGLASTLLHTVPAKDLQELARAVLDCAVCSAPHQLRSKAKAIPKTKASLILFLLSNIEQCASAWDQQLGDIVCVASQIRQLVARIYTLFQLVVPGIAEIQNVRTGAAAPMPPTLPPRVVLSALRLVQLPASKVIPPFFAPAVASPAGGDQQGRRVVQSHLSSLQLFRTSEELALCIEATALQQRLFEWSLPGGHCNNEDIDAASVSIQSGVDRCLELQRSSISDHQLQNSGAIQRNHGSSFTVLDELLVINPEKYFHLMRYTPLYQWLSCAEFLVAIVERAKRYAEAVRWLELLLSTSVFAVPSLWDPATKRYQKCVYCFNPRHRGYFMQRLVVDMVHSGRANAALSLAESYLEQLKENERQDPAAIPFWTQMERYCRRADRIAVERTMVRLWKAPRRWTAPPKTLLMNSLLEANRVVVHAARQPKSGMWIRQASWLDGHRGGSTVEDCALRWYVAGRGRRERGWRGVHCEGAWAASLFGVLFYNQLYVSFAESDFVYLSPFQMDPSDLYIPGAFYMRCKESIDARLAELQGVTRAQFVEAVRSVLSRVAPQMSGQAGEEDGPGELVGFLNRKLPLMDIAASVPILPLVSLYRVMLCSPLSSGQGIRFSGFPDLCLWRSGDFQDQPQSPLQRMNSSARAFLLAEVKSPTDKLSDKQHCVIDMLIRCGFEVDVAHVVDEFELPRCCSSRCAATRYLRSEILSE